MVGTATQGYLFFTHSLPSIEKLKKYSPPVVTQVYADNGALIAEFAYQRRFLVSIDEIPRVLQDAFVAAEDKNFWRHGGVDKEAILRGLTVRHLEQVRAIYDQIFTEDLVYLPLEVVIDRIVDPFVELQVACPEFKQILLGSDVSADIAAASEEMDEEIVERLARFLQQMAPGMDGQRARLVAVVCKAEVKALLSLITCDCSEDFRAQVTAEMKCMLFNYLASIFSGGEDAG